MAHHAPLGQVLSYLAPALLVKPAAAGVAAAAAAAPTSAAEQQLMNLLLVLNALAQATTAAYAQAAQCTASYKTHHNCTYPAV
jgi:hypothetical protein